MNGKTGRRLLATATMLYAVLLGASHLARRGRPAAALPNDKLSIETAEQGLGADAAGKARIAYRSWGERGTDGARAFLLLHGSPGSSADFLSIGPLLADGRFVVAPDLPGFGQCTHAVHTLDLATCAGKRPDLARVAAYDGRFHLVQ